MRLSGESTYPTIYLNPPVVVVQQVETSFVEVCRVVEELIDPKVVAYYRVGDEVEPRVCVVLEGENYFPDWDDTTVIDAITRDLNS